MQIPLLNFGDKAAAGEIAMPDSLSNRRFNNVLVHQMICANLANARQGTRAQKTRAEVSHTTRKLFRQKGSGQARAGMSSSPIRVGGGRAFPSRPNENFKQKTPRRMFRAAMAMLLARLLREERLLVLRSLDMEKPKTRELATKLSNMDLSRRTVLMVDVEINTALALAARNLPRVHYCPLRVLLPSDLAAADMTVMSESALKECMERWS